MKVLICYSGQFPYGAAMSSRIINFCRLFCELGYETHVIAGHTNENNIKEGNVYQLDGFTYEIVSLKSQTSLESFIGDKKFRALLKKYIPENKPDVVINATEALYYNTIISLCEPLDIPVFVEQCEWRDRTAYLFGKADYRYIMMNYNIKAGYKKAAGVISISRLFDKHYKMLGVPSIRIPTIVDVKNKPFGKGSSEQKIVITFTGSVGKARKEILGPLVNVLEKNSNIRKSVEVNLYGVSKTAVEDNIGKALSNNLNESFIIHGRVSQKEIEGILCNADFQLFIRPSRRSSNAGFPTKLGESMAVGTPVISNATGDIELYLKDGYNGFLLTGDNDKTLEYELENVLIKITQMSRTMYMQMRKNARETAEQSFDYRAYKKQMLKLLTGRDMRE